MSKSVDSEVASPDRRPGVTAVVVTYNSGAYIEQCLSELSGSVDDLVVVDNGSTDETERLVESSTARLIKTGRNAGFAAACNIGIGEASGTYVLIVNPDAWPLGDAVSSLVDCAERNAKAAVVAPGLVHEDGSHQRSVFGYPQNALSLVALAAFPRATPGIYGVSQQLFNGSRRRSRRDSTGALSVREKEFVSGAALLIRVDAVRELGGFDERFFFFSEEADLCFRLREAGWSVAYWPEARFVHVGAASSPTSRDWRYAELLRSYLLFDAKRRGVQHARWARRLLVAVLSSRAAVTTGEQKRCCKSALARLRDEDVLAPMV